MLTQFCVNFALLLEKKVGKQHYHHLPKKKVTENIKDPTRSFGFDNYKSHLKPVKMGRVSTTF